jgi:diaminopimelate decarboxylase
MSHSSADALPAVTQPRAGAVLDGVELAALAHCMATPLHAYSASAIRARIKTLTDALAGTDALVCFAVKANPNIAILQLVAQAGLGADIVSGGELQRTLRAGIAPQRIVFSGVGKSRDEIDAALDAGILRFNVESRDELECLQRLAHARGTTALAAARINPDVDARTHAKIATGKADNKFGVSLDEARGWFAERARFPNVRLDGLHVHIGSQLLDIEPYRVAFARVAEFWRELSAAGNPIASIDIGGGLGVAYRDAHDRPICVTAYINAAREALRGFEGCLVLEPGRWLVAEAGVLLTRVLRVKHGAQRDFLVLDAAMNDLQRPSLYDAWHEIETVAPAGEDLVNYDIVGPVCESADTFARARQLPRCQAGDLLMIRNTGAYGASMASTYNSRLLAAEVLLDRGRYAVVRRRQTLAELTAGEMPANAWLSP